MAEVVLFHHVHGLTQGVVDFADAVDAELFVYPGDAHLFADSSLSSYDADATALLSRRVLDFLGG